MEWQVVETEPIYALMARGTCTLQDIGQLISNLFGSIIQKNPEAECISPPRVYYTVVDEGTYEIEAALEVEEGSPVGAGTAVKRYPGGKCLTTTHIGSYEGLHSTWMQLWQVIQAQGFQPNGDPYDLYVTDPGSEPNPANWVTELYVPIA